MPGIVKRITRRFVSLLLTAAVLFSCLPAQAAGMSVQLLSSDASTVVPTGTAITFEVQGTGTSALALMVVLPDSRQQILEGASHEITFSQPGMYVIAGYGANGTDETAPGFERCMSAFHIVTAEGEALALPGELRGTLTLDGFTTPEWTPLRNAELRWNELRLRVNLTDQQIPEGARLQVDIHYNGSTRTVLDCDVGTDVTWFFLCSDDARELLAAGSGEPGYGRYKMSATASISTADGQRISVSEPFTMGWYSPEMLYVNQFYNDNWVYADSLMGERLKKWLDMSPREEGNRSSSGYLMLEQEILYRDNRKHRESYIKWAQKALSVVSSLGVELVFDAYSDAQAQKKFGKAGKDALPYYNMLGEVYNSYAQDLLENMQLLAQGAYVSEEIAKCTSLINYKKRIEAFYETGDLLIDAINDTGDEVSDTLMYVFTPTNHDSSYFVMGNANNPPDTAQTFKVTHVEEVPLPDGSGTRLSVSWTDADGVTQHAGADYFANLAYEGKRVVMDTSAVTGADFSTDQFETAMFRDMTLTSGAYNQVNQRDVVTTYIGADGKRKLKVNDTEVDFSAKKIQELGLSECLSPEDQQALKYFSNQVEAEKPTAWEMGGKLLDLAGIGLDVYQLYTNTTTYSDLQKAYFNTYKQISHEHIHALYSWYLSLENSSAEDRDAIQAAIRALMNDIYLSCDESLQNAAIKQNTFIQTAGMWANTIFDVMEFICDIPQVSAGLTKAAKYVGKSVVNATKTAVKWVVQATGNAGTVAAAGTAATTTAVSSTTTASTVASGVSKFAKTASMAMTVVSIGSLVYDLLFSAHIGYVDSIYEVYRAKVTLKDAIDAALMDYGKAPSHQRAVDIIESLYLMKELKLKGENLVIANYLVDMYKHYGLDGTKEQLVLMNEIVGMDYTYTLHGKEHMQEVYVVYENYIAGTRGELEDAGVDVLGTGFMLGGKDDYILDSRVVGIFRTAGSAAMTFQGVELEVAPAAVLTAQQQRSTREDADTFDIGEVDWIKHSNAFAPDWYTNMVKRPGQTHFVQTMWAYTNHGTSLLLTPEEYKRYSSGEAEVNRILRENDDATGDEALFWWEKEEWQHQQRIVWTYVTRKYIESLPMFDRAGG